MSEPIFPFPGLSKRSSGFVPKLIEVAERLRTNPNYLLAVMQVESGIDPAIRNPSGKATGLIQFMPSTARALGTTVDKLRGMSDVRQLDFVEAYYRPYAGRLRSAGDCYMVTFYPSMLGLPDGQVIAREGEPVYDQNAGLDGNHDGELTVGDVKARAENAYRRYAGLPPYVVPTRGSLLPWLAFLGLGGGGFWLWRRRRARKG